MALLVWSIVSVCILVPAVRLHNGANAQRPVALRQQVRVGSLRWWLPWPRRAEFLDEPTWRRARLAQVVLHAWAVAAFAVAAATFLSLQE